MGGGASLHDGARSIGRSEAEIVNLMMPIYYVDLEVTVDDIERASLVWQMIINDSAPMFVALKGTADFEYQSSTMMFFDLFYNRLFDIHPMSKPLFHNLKIQGRFLVKMISLCLSMHDDPKTFKDTLVALTEVHNVRGIKSGEYGIMGEVLFWTLKKCLGNEFDEKTHFVWVKILSRILKHMVPVAVAYELNTKSVNQKLRMSKLSLFHSQDLNISRSSSGDEKRSMDSCPYNEQDVEKKVEEMERKYSKPQVSICSTAGIYEKHLEGESIENK